MVLNYFSFKPISKSPLSKSTLICPIFAFPMSGICQKAQILIREILHVFLWLKFSPSLILNKIEHFETGSFVFKKMGSVRNIFVSGQLYFYFQILKPIANSH